MLIQTDDKGQNTHFRILNPVNTVSLLGPDDFDLDRKGRKKKLAKDLSPELFKQIDRWLDELDERELIDRLSEMVGPEEAQRLLFQARQRKKPRTKRPLMDD
ncbi:MAG: hypothetical protein RTU30_11075 [Candidatus Thorarchaeota archaeon]